MSKLTYQRLDDILDMLLQQTDHVSMKELTSVFNVSDRTIRTDINNLNDILKNVGASIVLIRGKGYSINVLNDSVFKNWRRDSINASTIALTSLEERQKFLLFTLFHENLPLSLDEFLDQLFVSKNTFYSYLKSIRDSILPYGLKIINRPNIGFEVIGSEFAKRQAISDLLIVQDLQEYLVGFTEMELSLFDHIDLELLKKIELACFKPLNLLDSDYYHKNILSHFALALSRISVGKTLSDLPVKIPTLKKEAQSVMSYFMTEIETSFDISLSAHEQSYFTYYLSVNAPRLVETEVAPSKDLASNIVEKLLSVIKETSNFDWLTDDILIKDLTSHIEGFINMNLMGPDRSNPLLETIKKSFPLAFDLCLTHLETIGSNYNLFFSEDEIGYIALHIAGAIERSSIKNHQKYRVLLICGTGRTMSRIIEAKINKQYQDRIEIVSRLSFIELQQYKISNIDFLISTVPLGQIETPYIYINMGKLDKDIEKIDVYMKKIKNQTTTIFDLFHQDNFIVTRENYSKEKILKEMVSLIESKNIVPKDFYESVWEREQMSQTNINHCIAIPHPMSLTSKESRIVVAIHPDGIDWGDNNYVNFIFLFAIKKEDYEDTEDIYTLLLDFIDREDVQRNILNGSTFNHFLNNMKSL